MGPYHGCSHGHRAQLLAAGWPSLGRRAVLVHCYEALMEPVQAVAGLYSDAIIQGHINSHP